MKVLDGLPANNYNLIPDYQGYKWEVAVAVATSED